MGSYVGTEGWSHHGRSETVATSGPTPALIDSERYTNGNDGLSANGTQKEERKVEGTHAI